MKMLCRILVGMFAGVLSANAQTVRQPPNSIGLNGTDTVTWSTTGSLTYAIWPVIIGQSGMLFASATSQLSCGSGGDATLKIIAGLGDTTANPATGATIFTTIVSGSMYVWAFAGGQGNGSRWLIKSGQELTDGSVPAGSVVHKNVFINNETFTGGYTNIFLNPYYDPNNPTAADPVPTVGDVLNIVFNNPALTGNPITVPYTIVSGDIVSTGNPANDILASYDNVTTKLTSAINANATLQAANIKAWSSAPPTRVQIVQLAGTPASTTLSYTKGTNTETIQFGLDFPGTPSPGTFDMGAGGAGIYSLTGTQPDITTAYPYQEMFTMVAVPTSGVISLAPEATMTDCGDFKITTISGIATGLTPGAQYWLNVSIRSISGSAVNYTNNFLNYMTY